MAKNYLRYLYFLFASVCFSSAFAYTSADSARIRVIKIAAAEIGVRELTGHNDGKRVEEFLASCGLKKGNPYCAAFVSWSFLEGGIKAIRSGYSPSWFPATKTIYTLGGKGNKTPLPADVMGIWIKDKSRIGHVGLVQDWPPGNFCTTIEANASLSTSGRKSDYDGQGVERKRRLKTQIKKISRWIY